MKSRNEHSMHSHMDRVPVRRHHILIGDPHGPLGHISDVCQLVANLRQALKTAQGESRAKDGEIRRLQEALRQALADHDPTPAPEPRGKHGPTPPPNGPKALLTTRELAERWGTSPGAIHMARHRGHTPPAIRPLGARALRWRLEDVEAWEAAHSEHSAESSA